MRLAYCIAHIIAVYDLIEVFFSLLLQNKRSDTQAWQTTWTWKTHGPQLRMRILLLLLNHGAEAGQPGLRVPLQLVVDQHHQPVQPHQHAGQAEDELAMDQQQMVTDRITRLLCLLNRHQVSAILPAIVIEAQAITMVEIMQ